MLPQDIRHPGGGGRGKRHGVTPYGMLAITLEGSKCQVLILLRVLKM